jgi:sigma-B regulation protein RsbU (phosphoserine phosphatase)
LIVEDDRDSRDVLGEAVHQHQHQNRHKVRAVADGQAALEWLDHKQPDLILLDITMPGMDGFAVLRRIRARWSPGELPVIMITGLGERQSVVEALRLGASDYIVKPFDASIVRARIETQLSLKRSYERILGLERDVERKNIALQRTNRELEFAYSHIKADLKSAARVQQSLLPSSMPQLPGVNVSWMYRPCDELAGDSLNVFELDKSHLGIYLLDVSGHGVPAALLSVAVSRALQPVPDRASLVQRRVPGSGLLEPTPPSVVAEELNRRYQLDPETYQYFTILYGLLNIITHELRYVCAGQAGPVYVPAGGQPRKLDQRGIAVGLVSDPAYAEGTLMLNPGDRLYLFSDGLDEARNDRNELFGTERVVRAVETSRTFPLARSLDDLVNAAEQWAGHPFDDDVSAIALEHV